MDPTEFVSAQTLEALIRFVFSWVMLMPISVIISGKLLAKPIQFDVTSKQLFRIHLKVLLVQATGSEVILGFTAFILVLFLVGVFGGKDAYAFVIQNFGIDPGHFNSLCILSSFGTVACSSFVCGIYKVASALFRVSFVDPRKYAALIARLTNKKDDS